MNIDLRLFVKEALEKGIARPEIEQVLRTARWPADEVRTALESYAEIDFVIPVPRRVAHVSAREAFLYLVLFMTLAISAISFGTIVFQLVNRWLPDPLAYDGFITSVNETLRSATAALIVAFPVFLFVSRLTIRAIDENPDLRLSRPRTAITYLAMFFASAVIIGSLIVLVTSVLGGELTMRFILKTLTVLAIAGSIFGYYLHDLKRAEQIIKT